MSPIEAWNNRDVRWLAMYNVGFTVLLVVITTLLTHGPHPEELWCR